MYTVSPGQRTDGAPSSSGPAQTPAAPPRLAVAPASSPVRSEPDLSERALNSAAYDQPPPAETPSRYFILSQRRSGSFMLCRALIRAGLGVPHEYFQPHHLRDLARRWGVRARTGRGGAPPDFLQALIDRRTANGHFGAKIQYWEYEKALSGAHGASFLSGAKFIYLYRRNLLKQAVSFRHAEITGRWGANDDVTTAPVRGDPFDAAAIDRNLHLLIQDEVGWRKFLARQGLDALFVSYEELRADFGATLQRIVQHLGAPAELARKVRPEPPSEAVRESQSMKARMLDAYLAAKRKAPARRSLRGRLARIAWSAWAGLDSRRA